MTDTETLRKLVGDAFEAGAKAVHDEWVRAHECGEGPPRGFPDFSESATDYAALTPSPEVQAEAVATAVVERKFYRSEWPIARLLEARNGGMVTDEGEAWTYRYSHKDGTVGEYDLLFRRQPITHPPAPQPDLAAQEQLKVMREALEIVAEGHPKDYTDNCNIAQKALDKCAALASVTAAQEGA